MDNRGWGLGTMLLCIAAVGICLITSATLIRKLERITQIDMVENKSIIDVINK